MSQVRLRSETSAEALPRRTAAEAIARGRQVLAAEQQAIASVAANLDGTFAQAVRWLLECRGCVIVSGIGKAGIIAQKLAASLSSTGTPSYFLHPAEAVHGDVGSVRACDVVLLLSYSGETEEVTRLLPIIRQSAAASIAITAHERSTLAAGVDLALLVGQHQEACPLGLAPSCTTTAMLALGDALALVVSEQRGFTREQFARFHPAGGLGKQLTRVEEVMRPLAECRVACQTQTLRQVLIHVGRPGRRTGAIMLTAEDGTLAGIFTDSDLARLLESSHESQLDQPICQVMTRQVQSVQEGSWLPDAMRLLATRKLSELPVVSRDHRPLGLVDITDVMCVMSDVWSAASAEPTEPAAEARGANPEAADSSPAARILPIWPHQVAAAHPSELPHLAQRWE